MLRNTRVFKNANNQTVVEVFSIEENIKTIIDKAILETYLANEIGVSNHYPEFEAAVYAQELLFNAYNGPSNYGKEYFNIMANDINDWSSINSDNWLSDLPLIMRKNG